MELCTRLQRINLYQCDPGFTTEERLFNYHYLLYVHKGKGIFKVSDTCLTCAMGDILYCPCCVKNTIIADETDPFLLSGIEFYLNQPAVDFLNIKINLLNNPFCTSLIKQMIEESGYNKIYSGCINDSLMSVLYLTLLRISRIGAVEEECVGVQIINYVKEHYTQDLTYKDLCRRFSYHKSSINRYMKAVTGMSLCEYLIDLRLKTAMELLAYSNRPQSEIARCCGYNSAVFFSRQFKEKAGCTPLEYRKSARNG